MIVSILLGCVEETVKPVVQIPEIAAISANDTFVGATLTILGRNFGIITDDNYVEIGTTEIDTNFAYPTIKILSKDCIKWSFTEIIFRIPDSTPSATIAVVVDKIKSNVLSINVEILPELETVIIPAGTFQMGSESGFANEKPVHDITLSQSYIMTKYEITQVFWEHLMGYNPSIIKGDSLPVHNISWYEALKFCNKLSIINKLVPYYAVVDDSIVFLSKDASGFKLPSEAEWEYASRAGTNGDFSGDGNIDNMGWYDENSGYTPKRIGQKLENAFGLHDMHGNVWEWCWDYYDADYYSSTFTIDPMGPKLGTRRVLRGGSIATGKSFARSANRTYPSDNYNFCGLRVIRKL